MIYNGIDFTKFENPYYLPHAMLARGENPASVGWQPQDVDGNTEWVRPGEYDKYQDYLAQGWGGLGWSFPEFMAGMKGYSTDAASGGQWKPAEELAPVEAALREDAYKYFPGEGLTGDMLRLAGFIAPALVGPALNALGIGNAGAAGTGAIQPEVFMSSAPSAATAAGAGGLGSAMTGTIADLAGGVASGAIPGVAGLPAGGVEAILGGTDITIPGPLGGILVDAAGNIGLPPIDLSNSVSTGGPTVPSAAAPTMPNPGAPVDVNPAVQNPQPTTGGAVTPASSLAKFLKDNLGIDLDPSTIGLLGTGLSTLLGAYASNKQSDALNAIANQARGDRLPALNAFNSALMNPNEWYSSAPAMGATDAVLRKLSAQVGNPALNPTALSQAAAYNLGGYNDYLRTMGNLGLSGQDTSIRAQTNAALGDTNLYNAIGSGIGSLTSNQPDYSQVLSRLLINQFGLT